MRFLLPSLVLLLALAGPARADGPPLGPLVPAGEAPADTESVGREFLPPALSEGAPPGHGRILLRRVLLAGGVGFAGLAIWRDAVADDRADDYDRAIFSDSAESLRDRVRSAESQRNVLAGVAAASFSFALASFVF